MRGKSMLAFFCQAPQDYTVQQHNLAAPGNDPARAPPFPDKSCHCLPCQAYMPCQFLLGDRDESLFARLSIEQE
jgi:hypothetical protein